MTRLPRHAIGVDIGGSHVLALSLDGARRPLAVSTFPRGPEDGVEGLLSSVGRAVAAVRVLTPGSSRWPVGVSFPGAFEGKGDRVVYAPNLPEWIGTNAGRQFARQLRTRVSLENDANCAAFGEFLLGPEAGTDLLYVSLGTGVGGGVVLHGRLVRGPWGLAGELGHVPVPGAKRRCGCGRAGCLETVAGGVGLAKACRRLARARPSSVLGRRVALAHEATAKELLLAAEAGDPSARAARDAAGELCGRAIGSAVNVLGVPRVVLGGRLTVGAPGFIGAIERGARATLLPPIRSRVRIRPAAHPGLRGAEGALLLAAGAGRVDFHPVLGSANITRR